MISKLSIITINRNNSEGLLQTINSVASQSMKDLEYIIIDGASTDESVEIIKYNQEKITFWVSENDNGIYHAMNKGIARASGTYCLFLNSGDKFFDNYTLKNIFDSNPVEDIVYANLEIRGKNRNRIYTFPQKITFYWLFTEFLGHPSTLIKRSLFDKFGTYNENYRIVSDWEFFLIVFSHHDTTYKHINHVLSIQNEGGISNNNKYKHIVEAERSKVLNEKFPIFINDYQELYNYKHNRFYKKCSRLLKRVLFIK